MRLVHPRRGHRDHLRSPGHLAPRHLRVEDGGDAGPHRGQFRGQRHRQQLRERLLGARLALDDRRRLLGRGARERRVALEVRRPPKPGLLGRAGLEADPGFRRRGQELVLQRHRLQLYRALLPVFAPHPPDLFWWRARGPNWHEVLVGRSAADPLAHLHRTVVWELHYPAGRLRLLLIYCRGCCRPAGLASEVVILPGFACALDAENRTHNILRPQPLCCNSPTQDALSSNLLRSDVLMQATLIPGAACHGCHGYLSLLVDMR
mmetsp:Transcript_77358/g.250357  ORF Transcript_77358/g.250357 Transcript_77358/m.250357 type:complete len:263 (+) Transcript_77358:2090-2878(+)